MSLRKNIFLFSLIVCSLNVSAETVTVVLTGVVSDRGTINTVLCKSTEGFPSTCKLKEVVNAKKGAVEIKFSNVDKGEYAFAAFHDENSNGKLDIGPSAASNESLVFSNNSMGKNGPPSYKQASFDVAEDVKLVLKMIRVGG